VNGFPKPDWQYTIVILCASVIEELFFRGFLFHRLLKYGAPAATLAASAFFAGMHLANFFSGVDFPYIAMQIFLSFCVSMSFCAVVLRWKSLLPVMLIHCLINLTASGSMPDRGPYPVFVSCGLVYLLYSSRLSHKKKRGSFYEIVH
jgi:membrane protease YdiL (CAAX protease family)